MVWRTKVSLTATHVPPMHLPRRKHYHTAAHSHTLNQTKRTACVSDLDASGELMETLL